MLTEYRFILPCTALEYEQGYRYVTGTSKRILKAETSLAHFVDNGIVGRQTEREMDLSFASKSRKLYDGRISTSICFPTMEAVITAGQTGHKAARGREEVATITTVLIDQDRGTRDNLFGLTPDEKRQTPVTVLDAVKLHQEMTCNQNLVVGGKTVAGDWLGNADVYCCMYVLICVSEAPQHTADTRKAQKLGEQARAITRSLIRGISRTTVKVLGQERVWGRLSVQQLVAIERYEFARIRGKEGAEHAAEIRAASGTALIIA